MQQISILFILSVVSHWVIKKWTVYGSYEAGLRIAVTHSVGFLVTSSDGGFRLFLCKVVELGKIAKDASWESLRLLENKCRVCFPVEVLLRKAEKEGLRSLAFIRSQASLWIITTNYLSPNDLTFLNFRTLIYKARLSIPTLGDVVSIEYENNANCLEQRLAYLSTPSIHKRQT